jgi:hypothetical protein
LSVQNLRVFNWIKRIREVSDLGKDRYFWNLYATLYKNLKRNEN